METGMSAPKISFALREGKVVHIHDVESGKHLDCVCPSCGKALIAKKGNILQHHFAHDHGTTCSFESILHKLGKTLIYEGVKQSIQAGAGVPLVWKCEGCGDEHRGNLLKKAVGVKLEQSLGPARPDVLLVNGDGAPLAAIEVVVSHTPEPQARQYYRDNHIEVLMFQIISDADIEQLRAWSDLRANLGTACTRRKCPICRHALMPSPLFVVMGDCYRCHSPMKIAFKMNGGVYGPDEFVEADIRRARAAGCILEVKYSDTMKSRYLANICGECRAFTGSSSFMISGIWRIQRRARPMKCIALHAACILIENILDQVVARSPHPHFLSIFH